MKLVKLFLFVLSILAVAFPFIPLPRAAAQTPTSNYRQTVLNDNPISYWRLGEASGTIAADEKAANPGSYINVPTLNQAGAILNDTNKSVLYNGSTQYTNVPYKASLNPNAFSVEAWAYPTGGTDYRAVVGSRSYPNGWIIYANSAGVGNQWSFWIKSGSGMIEVRGPVVTLNTWTHMIATFDGTTAKFYVNGALVGSQAVTSYVPTTTGAFIIGKGETGQKYYFNGRVDEVSFYNSVLTAAKVSEHYLAGTTAVTESPTPTLTPTNSPTPTNTPTPTNSPTPTPTVTPTLTPSNTPTPTDSPTPTPTESITPSVTPSESPTPTPTNSPTPTVTPTNSPTPTATPTNSPTPTVTPSSTPTPTPTTNPTGAAWGQATISLTFDDGYESARTVVAPLLAQYNVPATFYVNTQPANDQDTGYLNWTQTTELQNLFGFEVASHSYEHVDLSALGATAIRTQLTRSRDDLAAHGIVAESFATPYGAFNNTVNNEIAKVYASHRTAWNINNGWPIVTYDLRSILPQANNSVAQVKAWIDTAIANNEWLVLTYHDVTTGSSAADYQVTKAHLEEVIQYLKTKNVALTTVKDVVNAWGKGLSLIPNGSFETGTSTEATGWTRSSSKVALSVAGTGAYPAPTKSMVINTTTATSVNSTVTSNKFALDASKLYRFKSFARITNYNRGVATFQIKEYNSLNTLIGTKTLGTISGNQMGNVYYDYTPTLGTTQIEVLVFNNANARLRTEIDALEFKER